MKKEEFMKKLEHCLQEISYEERQAALRYYEEYFEEAGADENTVGKLDSPEQIAKAIKEDLDIRLQTVRSSLAGKKNTGQDTNQKQEKTENNPYSFTSQDRKDENLWDKMKGFWNSLDKKTKDILIVIAAVILFLSIISNGFGLLFNIPFSLTGGAFHLVGWIFALICLIFGLTIAGYAMVLGGIILFVVSIVTMFNSIFHGLFLTGTSLLLIGFGLFFVFATMWFWSSLMPKVIQMIKDLFQPKDNGKGGTAI